MARKSEKKIRNDLTPLQQNVKRKTQDPGATSDYAVWTGATSSKYRWASYLPPLFGFALIHILSTSVGFYLWRLETLSLADVISTVKTYGRTMYDGAKLSDAVLAYYTFDLVEIFSFTSSLTSKFLKILETPLSLSGTTLKNMTKDNIDTVTLVDTCTPVKNP